MFDLGWFSDLDRAGACEALATAQQDLLEVETRQLLLAAAWLDLHGDNREPDEAERTGGRVLPGTGRYVPSGADGTPEIEEFACAEFAALQGMHPLAGARRLAAVANLRHRQPQLWQRVLGGETRGWQALEVARIVGKPEYDLTLSQAHWVDAQTTPWIDALPWGRFLSLLEAKIIACDPEAAEARRRQAEADQFVATGRSNEHGLKVLIAKANAGDMIYLQAMCDRLAQILALNGDTRPIGPRRAAALGILATPARAQAMLEAAEDHAHQAAEEAAEGRADQDGDDSGEDSGDAPDLSHRRDPDELTSSDLHPAHDDSEDRSDPPRPCPDCSGTGMVTGDPRPFRTPIPPEKLLPKATVYVHLTQHGFETRQGVARMEGVGPITIGAAQDFLGHTNVKVVPVLDLADRRPVDGYEFPASSREAVHLTTPADAFPYAPSTSRRVDLDHPTPYLAPDEGGPPGQTNTGNAAPMTRRHHRIKTHGRWRLRQIEPGSYLWRSPHGYYFLTGHNGTHRLSSTVGEIIQDAVNADLNAA